jgi:hypothetical protein
MSFAKLLTTVLLAAYTLAAPLAVLDTVTNTADNIVNPNAILSPIEGVLPVDTSKTVGSITGGLPTGKLPLRRDGSLAIADTATNTVDNIAGSNPVTATTLDGVPIVGPLLGGLLGGLGPKRDVPNTAALSQEAVAALVKEGSAVVAVSHTGEIHVVTDTLKSALSTRGLVGEVGRLTDSLTGNVLRVRDVPSTTALSHEAIADLLQKGGKLVVVDPSEKVHDITSTFVPALTTRDVAATGSDVLNGASEMVNEAEGTVDSISAGLVSLGNVPIILGV